MTGFARSQGSENEGSWAWEIKSVNGRGLDIRCRVPPGLESLDVAVRERVAKRLRRGNLQIGLTVKRERPQGGYRVNRDVLDHLLSLVPEVRQSLPDAAPPSVDGLLALRGVIEQVEVEEDEETSRAFETAVLAGFDAALSDLAAVRDAEGGRLAAVLTDQLAAIDGLCEKAAALAATQPDAIRERMHEQVAALLEAAPELPEERLVQEAALLAAKADVREELDRLSAHIEAARDLMAQDGAIGRKLDFLCQELNREVNTLCSKSSDMALTGIGLDLKAAVEQMREQVQNIE
ncbi:MAG: YicC/YloC family endoribonuclease [Rhodospirillales bacterium]|jgi:uncharacterized protein (TIGR00255 family)|nr:YicC/YloC family endoribonuclease [Rhodospirillales bacterium]